ncbi:hypothetical protein [Selenomonas ruminis]|uniref:Uncharacterized protein n=1 Tax=Selenomonas ruminis TaxID=2593411 RepID=A0A5D6W690_9FIRM|nr:hypothetical protein [Selenomonas sp. mPRGC5]TYZ23971.1 hypothetical protein FZ040_04425 [Selenomonas sp. mPRGC5]
MSSISFLKQHGKVISNVLVALLVIGAIYTKVQENGADSLFRMSDLQILAGAILGLLVIRWFNKRHKK